MTSAFASISLLGEYDGFVEAQMVPTQDLVAAKQLVQVCFGKKKERRSPGKDYVISHISLT